MSVVAEALSLATQKGFAVFPVWGWEMRLWQSRLSEARQTSMYEVGFKKATTDPETIEIQRWVLCRCLIREKIANGCAPQV